MNNEEIQALMSQLKNAGLSEEDIANGILWPLFRDGKMSKEDLSTLCASIGLELDEDFEKDEGPKDGEGAPAITKEEAEEAKEIKPGESKEEFEEKVEDMAKPEEASEEGKEEDDGEKPAEDSEPAAESEDEEWEEAKKLFKL